MGSLEKAARAAYEAYRSRVPSAGPPWDQLGAGEQALAVEQTRAVLLAVREPDEAVFDDVWLSMYIDRADVVRGYQGVIDAVLKEGKNDKLYKSS